MNDPDAGAPFDTIVVGAGPAGSTLAYHLAKSGCNVLIVDKTPFPRHRIGESLTGECGKLLRQMGLEAQMEEHRFPIKHGVKVSGPSANSGFYVPIRDKNKLGNLVPHTTWQVRRPEFDQMLLDTAIKAGAKYQLADAKNVIQVGKRVTGLRIKLPDGRLMEIPCRILADASGQSTFLCNRRITSQRENDRYNKQIAFFAQLKGVRRDPPPEDGNTVLFYASRDKWCWLIPLDDDVTSIGVVLPAADFKDSGKTPEEFFTDQLLSLHPDMTERTSGAEQVSEIWRKANYSYQVNDFVGEGYICIGDAHCFLDPIFSFGVWMGMKEAVLASVAIQDSLNGDISEKAAFESYRTASSQAQQIVRYIVNTFWEYPLAFLKLAHFSHKDEIADLFAGRIFDEDASELEVVKLMHGLFAKEGD